MARARNIKPSLFKNEILGDAEPLLTILFTGLWCLADREGRLEDRPKRIKAEIFPYRDGLDVDEMLSWLEEQSFINRYRIDNESFIQVTKFHEHQNPHHMEAESVIPPMPGHTNKLNAKPLYKKQKQRILERDGHRCMQCGSTKKLHIDHIVPVSKGGTSDDDNLQVLCEKCNTSKGAKIVHESSTNRPRIVENGSCPTDSLNPLTDSLLPSFKKDPPLIPPFEQWWSLYPTKVGKKPCREKWKRKKLDEQADVLIAKLRQQVAEDARWLDGFAPNPETYLNQERWTDEIQRTRGNGHAKRPESFHEMRKRLYPDARPGVDDPRDRGAGDDLRPPLDGTLGFNEP